MATTTAINGLSLSVSCNGTVKISTAEAGVNVYCTGDSRPVVSFPIQSADNLVWARNAISMAAGATGSDIDLNAVIDADTGISINFAYVLGVFVFNTTADQTAHLDAQKGGATAWDVPFTGWKAIGYGYDTSGRMLPGYVWNPNHSASYGWVVTNGATDTIRLIASTPATATTLTGQLIIVGTTS